MNKITKDEAIREAIKMGVDFDKDFHAQTIGNEMSDLAKKTGYRKSKSASGSLGRAFFEHLEKIYDKNPMSYSDNVKIEVYGTKGEVEKMYLDYVNNFMTVKGFADHYDMTEEKANRIIDLGREHLDGNATLAKGGTVIKKGNRVRVVNTKYDGKEGLVVSNDLENGNYQVQVDGKVKGFPFENLMLLSRETYSKGGEVGDEVEIELTNDRIVKGKIEKLNPLKIRTDATSTQVIPNSMIKSIKNNSTYAKDGGIEDDFEVNGTYSISNSGGYEIMISPDGMGAKVRDAFGSNSPTTTDWLEIEYIDGEPVIDPEDYNIPLNDVIISENFKNGGEIGIGSNVDFNYHRGETRTGTIVREIGDDSYEIHSGARRILVDKDRVIGEATEKKKRFSFFDNGGEVVNNYEVGDVVMLSENGWDNDSYHDFLDNKKDTLLLVTDVYRSESEHQGFDDIGQALYSLIILNSNEEVPFDLYDYELEIDPTYSKGGRVITNEGILTSFLESTDELKVGNLTTHYSTMGAVVLLRNYGTLIAKRKGKKVSITSTKYSKSTTTITNKLESLAKEQGFKVDKISEDEFGEGGGIEGENGYIAFYKGKQIEVYATSSYSAQQKASKLFKAKKSYDVTVVLAEKDGEQVTHNPMFDNGGGVEDDSHILLKAIKEHTEDNSLEINAEESNYIEVEGDEGDYIVFENYDDARDFAIERVKQDLEYEPEIFTQSWLLGYLDENDTKYFFKGIYEEMDKSYAEDIKSESGDTYANRLLDEMVERSIMSDEEAESNEAEDIADSRIDLFVESMVDDKLDGGNGYEYWKDNIGEEEAIKLVFSQNLINIDDASEGAVDEDGVAHFLGSYSGDQIELSNDAVAYRTN